MSANIKTGTYYIANQYTATVLTFADNSTRTNLTAWEFVDTVNQRWNVTNLNGVFTIKNIASGNYISYANLTPSTSSPYNVLYANATAFPWLIQEYHSGYLMGSPLVDDYVVNLEGSSYSNNTNVIMSPLDLIEGPSNSVWYFNETTPNGDSSFTAPNRSHSNPGTIAGSVIGGLALFFGLVVMAFVFGRRHSSTRTSAAPTTTKTDPPFSYTTFVPVDGIPAAAVAPRPPPAPEPQGVVMSVTHSRRLSTSLPELQPQPQNPVFTNMRNSQDVGILSGNSARSSDAESVTNPPAGSLKKPKTASDYNIYGSRQSDSLVDSAGPSTYGPGAGDDHLSKDRRH